MLKKTLSILFMLILICSSVAAIEHPSVKIITYDPELFQEPGTTKTYQVTVTNTGDVPLDSVYLSLFFLPSTWQKFETGVRLEIDETKTLSYNISVPSDASGSITYKLTANAIRGFGIVSNSTVPVVLTIQKVQATQTTTPIQTNTATVIQTNETTESETSILNSNAIIILLVIAVSVVISLVIYKIA